MGSTEVRRFVQEERALIICYKKSQFLDSDLVQNDGVGYFFCLDSSIGLLLSLLDFLLSFLLKI